MENPKTFARPKLTLWFPQLLSIHNKSLRGFTSHALTHAPAYWWTTYSSLKHHTVDERGEGGRVRHAQKCAVLSISVAEALSLSSIDRDLLISASFLHDICCRGADDIPESPKTVYNHPMLVQTRLQTIIDRYTVGAYDEHEWMDDLFGIIESHMGKWGPRVPVTDLEKLFHLIDYVASRSFIQIKLPEDARAERRSTVSRILRRLRQT